MGLWRKSKGVDRSDAGSVSGSGRFSSSQSTRSTSSQSIDEMPIVRISRDASKSFGIESTVGSWGIDQTDWSYTFDDYSCFMGWPGQDGKNRSLPVLPASPYRRPSLAASFSSSSSSSESYDSALEDEPARRPSLALEARSYIRQRLSRRKAGLDEVLPRASTESVVAPRSSMSSSRSFIGSSLSQRIRRWMERQTRDDVPDSPASIMTVRPGTARPEGASINAVVAATAELASIISLFDECSSDNGDCTDWSHDVWLGHSPLTPLTPRTAC